MDPSVDFSKNPVFSKSYWERPTAKDQGDPDSNVVYTAVGNALSGWELAEQELAELFLALVEGRTASDSPIRRAYGAIESNAGRRNVIEAAAQAYFGEHWDNSTVQNAFSMVLRAVAWASRRRDDIAHGIVKGYVLDGRAYGSFLFPPDYNTQRTTPWVDASDNDPLRFMMTKYRFVSADIYRLANRFTALREAIKGHKDLIRRDGKTIIFVRAVLGGSALSGE